MLLSLLTLLLISNALTLRKDKSILFSRVVMVSLIHTSFLAYNNLFFLPLGKGIGILGGLFHVTVFTQIFNIFIFIFIALTWGVISFYPRKQLKNKVATLFYIINKKYYYKAIKRAFRIVNYSLLSLFAVIMGLLLLGLSEINYVKFLCLISNSLLLVLLLEKKDPFKNKLGLVERIKLFFNLDKKHYEFLFSLFFSTWVITVLLRIQIFSSLDRENIFLIVYGYLVMYPFVVLTLNLISEILICKNPERFTLAMFKKIGMKTSQSVRLKNLFLYVIVCISGRIVITYVFTSFFISYALCDGKDTELWTDKQIIVKGQKITVSTLNQQKVEELDKFNLVEHKDIKQMEVTAKQLNKIISTKNIPEIVLTAPHFLGVVTTDLNKISNYVDFEGNRFSNDKRVQHFKDYLEVPCDITSENSNIESYNQKGENTVLISRDNFKNILYNNNKVRVHNPGLITLSRALVLDNIIYSDTYLNPILNLNRDLNRLNQEFIDFKFELDYLNLALEQYKTGNYDGKNFSVFQKRQISYHLDAITKLLADEKYGLNLNPNYEVINNILVKSFYTRGQHKSVIGSMLLKFLIPDSNDYALRVRDFTNPEQVYQELVENMIFVQLNYLVRHKILDVINNSEIIIQLLSEDTLPPQQRAHLLSELNLDLENTWRAFLKENSSFYKHLQNYYLQRGLDFTNLKCRVDSLQGAVDLHHHTSHFLHHNKYSSSKWGIGLTSRLGLNRAQEFAFNSPFIEVYDKSDRHSTREWVNTYWYIGVMANRNRILD